MEGCVVEHPGAKLLRVVDGLLRAHRSRTQQVLALPQGLATIATDHHARMIEKHRSRLMELQKEKIGKLKDLATAITKQSINIEANANDDGHLYGSVGAPEIVAALKQNDIDLTVDQIRLDGPLRELGLYTVKVHVYQDIESELKVWVVPDDDNSGNDS